MASTKKNDFQQKKWLLLKGMDSIKQNDSYCKGQLLLKGMVST